VTAPKGRGCGRNADGQYCCLRVLADVVDPEAWDEELVGLAFYWWREDWAGFLPRTLLSQEDQHELTKLNDPGFTFERTVDWIGESVNGSGARQNLTGGA
jgi:hypothetical protein